MQDYSDITINLKFTSNSGTQYEFKPFVFANKTMDDDFKSLLGKLAKRDDRIRRYGTAALQFTRAYADIAKSMRQKCERGGTEWAEVESNDLKDKGRFIRYRLGEQKIIGEGGESILMYGIWFAMETNQGSNNRGTVIEIKPAKDFSQETLANALQHKDDPQPNVYMQLQKNSTTPVRFSCKWTMPTDDEDSEPEEISIDIELKIGILEPNGETVPVDLVLDLGNSRSVALLLEHGNNNGFEASQFSTVCKPVALRPSFWDYYTTGARPKDACIISSSLVLQTPRFETGGASRMGETRQKPLYLHEWTFKEKEKSLKDYIRRFKGETDGSPEYEVVNRTTRLPQMFVKLSPVLLGMEAEQALDRSVEFREAEARFFQSSPKRYYWDLDQKANLTYWNMLPPPWVQSTIENRVPTLECELLRFMPVSGAILNKLDVEEGNPESSNPAKPEKAIFPRASSLTWMLLAILERAWEQANLDTSNFRPKALRNIIITYPSGWLPKEIAMYRERCQEAVNIFAQTNFPPSEQSKIKLVMNIDEAVASQMPFVFTEITQFNSCDGWIKLMGQKHGGKASVRIMNLDIGGGTTDFSIIDYSSAKIDVGKFLLVDLLYKDGFAVAGDNLLRMIIDKIIIDGIVSTKSEIKGLKQCFEKHFKNGQVDLKSCINRSLQVKQILIPMAVHFLSLHNSHSQSFVFSPEDAGISADNWNKFTKFLDKDQDKGFNIPCTERFAFSDKEVPDFVEVLFKSKFETCAAYASAYGVDLLVLSGKTSELPEINQLICEVFPMTAYRIIPTRNYQAGSWYPNFNNNSTINFISDAKTVTAVGAALHFSLANGLINGWTIKSKNSFAQSTSDDKSKNIWSTLRGASISESYMLNPNNLVNFLKKNDTESKTCIITDGSLIFRQLEKESHPEPVFMFKTKKDGKDTNIYDVSFMRTLDEFGGDSLQITGVFKHCEEPPEGERENLMDNFELRLHPTVNASGADNWQESGLLMS